MMWAGLLLSLDLDIGKAVFRPTVFPIGGALCKKKKDAHVGILVRRGEMVAVHFGYLRMAIQAMAASPCILCPIPTTERMRDITNNTITPVFNDRPPRAFSSYFLLSPGSRSSAPQILNVCQNPKEKKPRVCTADELHYADVPGTDWRIALWRYVPCSKAPLRNHPLVLLSGVGTNAIGFDLSPEASFARHMSTQGFDTWIVEVRGAGLSSHNNFKSNEHIPSENVVSDSIEYTEQECQNGSTPGQKELDIIGSRKVVDVSVVEGDKANTQTPLSELQSASQLNDALEVINEKISDYLSESQSKEKNSNMLEESRYSIASNQIRDLRKRFLNILDEVQRSISPPFLDLQRRFLETIEDFQKQLDFVLIYDWDFDHYLEEDIPIAIEYIKSYTKPKDGKLLAIGHSMGGILLYAMLSRCGFKGRESEFAAVVTLASSLDYAASQSSLKLLLPLANPAETLNVPIVPLGALMAAAYPLASSPPYVLSWLNPHVSAKDMMHPELFEKLCLNNFCTIPAKLLLQLSSVFRDGGLRDRSGMFCYKDHIHKSNTPVFAIAGDQDLICPPDAVYETVKLIPQHLVSYKLFGKPEGPHYGHFDIVGGRMVQDEVYPCIVEFLCQHDGISEV